VTEPKQEKRKVPEREKRGIKNRTQRGYLIAFVIFIILLYGLGLQVNSELRNGCERLDEVRSIEYDVLKGTLPSLEAQIPSYEKRGETEAVEAIELRVLEYEEYIEGLINSVEPYGYFEPDNGDINNFDQLRIDCVEAYPKPAPMHWFETEEASIASR
jgi:hypothetical protein